MKATGKSNQYPCLLFLFLTMKSYFYPCITQSLEFCRIFYIWDAFNSFLPQWWYKVHLTTVIVYDNLKRISNNEWKLYDICEGWSISMQTAMGWGRLFSYFPMDYATKLQISLNKHNKNVIHSLIDDFRSLNLMLFLPWKQAELYFPLQRWFSSHYLPSCT